MLPRNAFRALRMRPGLAAPLTAPRAAPIASTLQWIRSYANNNRPPRNNTWKRSDPIKFDESNKSRPNPVNPQQQPEFDTAAAPERNTTAQSGEARQAGNTEPTTESSEPQKPLPDLRQGIPSTFAAEFAKAEAKAKRDPEDPANVTEDPDKEPQPGGAGGREGGELPKSAYETSTDRRRNRVANWSYLSLLVFGGAGAVYMGRNWDTEEEEKAHPEAPSGWGFTEMYNRILARINSQKSYYTEPTFQNLLPDIEKAFPPGQAPTLTLVLSLEDLLVHSEWSTKHGWRTAKRPGVDYFLRYLSQYYELVIFTSAKSMDADPVIRKLDPFRIVMWPLYREATRYEKGEYIKDLSCLNRDLSKTIIVDTDPTHVKLQPENAIVLPKWDGRPGDRGLVNLIPFLEYLAMMSQGAPIDVRRMLKSMEGKDVATEYAVREARLREQFNRDMAAEKAKKGKFNVAGSLMSGLGMSGANQQGAMILPDGTNVREGMLQGKMMIDMFREMGRKNYEVMDKEIRENGDKWLQAMAEEEKKLQEEHMKSMKAGAFGWLGGSAPPPPNAPLSAEERQQ